MVTGHNNYKLTEPDKIAAGAAALWIKFHLLCGAGSYVPAAAVVMLLLLTLLQLLLPLLHLLLLLLLLNLSKDVCVLKAVCVLKLDSWVC